MLQKWGYKNKAFVNELFKQMKMYHEGIAPYNFNTNDYRCFWNQMTSSSLKEVAIKLISFSPHSANCERLFSTMSYIKKKWQNQMSESTLTAYAQIKIRLRSDNKKSKNKIKTNEMSECQVVELCDDETVEDELEEDELVDGNMFDQYIIEEDEVALIEDWGIEALFNIKTVPFFAAHIVDDDEQGWDINDYLP